MSDDLLSYDDISFKRDDTGKLMPQKIPIDLRDTNMELLVKARTTYLETIKEALGKTEDEGEKTLLQSEIDKEIATIDKLKEIFKSSGDGIKKVYATPILQFKADILNSVFKDPDGSTFRMDGDGTRILSQGEERKKGINYSQYECQDDWVICTHCINPVITPDNIRPIRGKFYSAIRDGIFAISGFELGKNLIKAQKAIDDEEAAWRERMKNARDQGHEESLIVFLTKRNITPFELPKYSHPEIRDLIKAWKDKGHKIG